MREVWARSGGICAFPGCPEIVYKDKALLQPSAFGEVAHNVAAGAGERSDPRRSIVLSDDPENLILFCPNHHRKVDRPGAGKHYTESLLRSWKQAHERNVRLAAQLGSAKEADALLVLGPIGGHPVALDTRDVPVAMFQRELVLAREPREFRIDPSDHAPKSAAYWQHAIARTRGIVRDLGQTSGQKSLPFAVFALADMPTLMAVGFALGNLMGVKPFQWDPVGESWKFPDPEARPHTFEVVPPERFEGEVVLVISLSAPIERARVAAAMNDRPHCVMKITVPHPTMDLIRTPKDIDAFARCLRDVMATLERKVPKAAPIHVMPAMPASLAVKFGSLIKPKVSHELRIYDAQGPGGPFEYALSLPFLRDASASGSS